MSHDDFMVLATQVSMLSVQDLMWGPALRKFPALKIAWSEGGIGWIPFLLDRCDRHYLNQQWTGQDFGDKLPSDVFREHALACFISDPTSLKLYKEIGIDIIAFESDYPHSDCLWPDAPESLLAQCAGAGCTDEDIHKIALAERGPASARLRPLRASSPRNRRPWARCAPSRPTSTPASSPGRVAGPVRKEPALHHRLLTQRCVGSPNDPSAPAAVIQRFA